MKVGNTNITTKLSKQLAGLMFLQACPDGSFDAVCCDTVHDQVIQTTQKLLSISGNGVQQSVAHKAMLFG